MALYTFSYLVYCVTEIPGWNRVLEPSIADFTFPLECPPRSTRYTLVTPSVSSADLVAEGKPFPSAKSKGALRTEAKTAPWVAEARLSPSFLTFFWLQAYSTSKFTSPDVSESLITETEYCPSPSSMSSISFGFSELTSLAISAPEGPRTSIPILALESSHVSLKVACLQ